MATILQQGTWGHAKRSGIRFRALIVFVKDESVYLRIACIKNCFWFLISYFLHLASFKNNKFCFWRWQICQKRFFHCNSFFTPIWQFFHRQKSCILNPASIENLVYFLVDSHKFGQKVVVFQEQLWLRGVLFGGCVSDLFVSNLIMVVSDSSFGWWLSIWYGC